MDFDEYDYLEKTVESAEPVKGSNGSDTKSKSAEKRRLGEEDNETEDGYKSKRHGSRDGDRDKSERSREDRDRSHREKSRDRSDRDRDRDRHRDRGERNYQDPEREHRDGERRRHSRDLDRDREHEKERDERRYRKERSHSRTRDHERHDKETSRPRDFDRDHRYPREKREKKEEAAEPEADPERDQRTVFAFQGCWSPGKVRDVRLIMDRNTRRSKGVGYIEFYDAMSVPMAIALTGQLLLGQPVMVKPSEAEKNLVQSTSTTTTGAVGGIGPYSGSARRLYVGNLHFNIGEEQLRQVFDPFGPIELVQLPIDPDTGHHKGYGFVQYTKLEDARAATALNGTLELAGRVIKVVPMTDQGSMPDSVVAPGELDDDDGGGLSLTARSRALLMQKLDRSGTVQNIVSTVTQAPPFNMLSAVTTPAVAPVVPGLQIPGMVGVPTAGLGAATLNTAASEPIGMPSECLLLRNMFDPSTETDPDFDMDIKEEVQSECGKYGALKHIYVDKNSAGHVYLRFGSMSSATNAQKALYGRWFAGKMITTSYMTIQAYEAKFPDSR